MVAKFREARLLYVFVGAFVMIALSFAVEAAVTRSTSSEIERSTQHMLANAIPSITAIMNARTSLRRIPVDRYERGGDGADWSQIAADVRSARRDLDEDIKAEAATPWYPGELEVYQLEVIPKVDRLDRAIGDLDRAAASDPRNAAGKERALASAVAHLNATADDVDSSLQAWEQVNHTGGFVGASQIASSRSRLAQTTIAMQLVSSLAALAAAAIAVSVARRFARVAQHNSELETRRANELDGLAQRVSHDLMSPLAAVSLSLACLQRAHTDEDRTRLVQRASRSLERSRQLAQCIYQFAKSGGQPVAGATSPVQKAVIEAVDDLVAAEATAPPVFDVQPFDEVEVACERAALGVVLSNLLANAAKFSRDSPQRRIFVRAFTFPRRYASRSRTRAPASRMATRRRSSSRTPAPRGPRIPGSGSASRR
jgi:signal transduction histidine kinase